MDEPRRDASKAIQEATELLVRAERSVIEAREDFHGDLFHLATRLSRHLHFLKEVSELLSHEIEQRDVGRQAVLPFPALKRLPRART